MLFDLYFAEASRVFQSIEDQKGAVPHAIEGDTVARKWRGGLEILEKHGALTGRDQRHPIPALPDLVVDLELSKRFRLSGAHGDTLAHRLAKISSKALIRANWTMDFNISKPLSGVVACLEANRQRHGVRSELSIAC
jgi:hypothetical protein